VTRQTSSRAKAAIASSDRSLARAVGTLLLLGALVVALPVALPHPSDGDTPAQIAIGAAMAFAGTGFWAFAGRMPALASHAALALTAAAAGALVYVSTIAAGGYGSIFVWATLISSYFFRRRVAVAHLAWVLAIYGAMLLAVESTAGYSPFTRWLTAAVSLTVVMLLTSEIVNRRARADGRARRFFDLSHDLLSTMDLEGRCVEINAAWRSCLGYRPEEMEGRPLLEITHPGDVEHATRLAAKVFRGEETEPLEARVRAKDGSWHWLRSTAAYAPDERLVYARSTDITKLKRIEAEREELLKEVERLARSDSLTGLPNRRALEEILPREMSRARRSRSPLWLAIVDIDLFKSYNDSHGHPAGDALLRDCARAWEGEMRAADLLARFGGEEFVVVLPDCESEEASAIVERLRAATPDGQTVSAGLAGWDFEESGDDLLERADRALYAAKESGRDRLVAATSP
jgi:diguanylate cyclase (GGDEF)-like protein/PAS domain S-box-containing protein